MSVMHPQHPTQQQQQQIQQQQMAEVDPINRIKVLVPMMKKSLQNLMEVAANIFHQNSHVDTCVKGAEAPTDRFDKCLEEFYAHCDQVESTLKLALECHAQNLESQRNTPIPLQISLGPNPTKPPEQGQEQFSYAQYLTLCKTQINCAKEIHEALQECARKICDRHMQAPSSVGAVGSN